MNTDSNSVLVFNLISINNVSPVAQLIPCLDSAACISSGSRCAKNATSRAILFKIGFF